MATITETLSADHRRCDDLFAQAEALIADGEWTRGEEVYASFRDATEHHFSMEEEVLFPGFEGRTGQSMGPTRMMRMEHEQMRQLFAQMGDAVAQQNRQRYLGLAETLMIIMQQHNMKEEQMLYRMSDQVFGTDAEAVVEAMERL